MQIFALLALFLHGLLWLHRCLLLTISAYLQPFLGNFCPFLARPWTKCCPLLQYSATISETISINFYSPCITMIQKSSPENKKGVIYSAYQFYTVLAGVGCLSTILFCTFMDFLDCTNNPVMIGKLLAVFGTIGYLGGAASYFVAGKHFKIM